MRTNHFLIIYSLVCFTAGSAAALAMKFTNPLFATGLGVAGVVLLLAAIAWSIARFKKLLNFFHSDVLSQQGSGFKEFDQIRGRQSEKLKQQSAEFLSTVDELAELKALLQKIDRRDLDVDRDGTPLRAADRLRGILNGYEASLESNVQKATSCGRELKRAVEELVEGSETQYDLFNQVTGHIEELSAYLVEVCDKADETRETSTNVNETIQAGLQRLEQLVEQVKLIRQQSQVRERKVKVLGQHAKEIESIVQTIGSLSSRTDLLALNASIESVRAGEHGRGFAIVAEEVRALAEQSAQAVLDISSRIEAMQQETQQSEENAADESQQAQDVLQSVNESLESLNQVLHSASTSAVGIESISANANHQLEIAQSLIATVEQGTECSQQNRSRAEGANWTAKTLGEVSDEMEQSMDIFKSAIQSKRTDQLPTDAPMITGTEVEV